MDLNMIRNFNSVSELKRYALKGFKTIKELMNDYTINIPRERGIYMVLYLGNDKPVFLKKGVGGYFKNRIILL